MARLASRASAGYYPLPSHLCGPVAALVRPHKDRLGTGSSSALDPCCGRGEVLGPLAEAGFRAVGVELERGRAEAADKLPRVNVAHGDAFRVERNFEASVLYLNPPYDDDRVFGRVEHKFLERFTGFLLAEGVLIFVVPIGAIPACAEHLARHYRDLECWRFPDEDFPVYKQVILRGVKRPTPLPFVPEGERVVLEQWALGVAPVFVPGAVEPLQAPESHKYISPKVNAVDLETVRREFRPFTQTLRYGSPSHMRDFCPAPGEDLFCDGFRSAMPPLPPHLAPAIAAGVFNGEEVAPDKADSGLPRLLVKGVFTRYYAVKDENQGADGGTTSILQQQEPRLDVTVLDLERFEFHDLINSAETTDVPGVAGMSIADLFARYGRGLLAILNRKCRVDYDPRIPSARFPLPSFHRPLFEAQEHAVRGALTQLGGPAAPFRSRRDRACVVLGEIGSGKTSVALATMYAAGAPRVVVMCPPHLLKSWQDQTGAVLGLAGRATLLETEADLRSFVDYERKEGMPMLVGILSREMAKLGHSYAAVTGSCPGCFGALPSGNLAARRARCKNVVPRAQNLEASLLESLVGHVPVPQYCVEGLRVRSRINIRLAVQEAAGEKRGLTDGARAALEGVAIRLLRVMERLGTGAEGRNTYSSRVLPYLNHYLSTLGDPAAWILGQYRKGAVPCLDWLALLSVCGDRGAYDDMRKAVQGEDSYNYLMTQIHFRDAAAGRVYCRGIEARIEGGRLSFPGSVEGLVEALGKNASFEAAKCGEPLYQAVPVPRRYPLSKTLQKLARKRNLDFGLVLDECFPGETPIATERGPIPIENVKVGDLVWSRVDDGGIVLKRVVRRFVKTKKALVRVTHEGGLLDCTPEHRFWTPCGYVAARDLLTPSGFTSTFPMGSRKEYAPPDPQNSREALSSMPEDVQVLPRNPGEPGTGVLFPGMWERGQEGHFLSAEQGDGEEVYGNVPQVRGERGGRQRAEGEEVLLKGVPELGASPSRSVARPRSTSKGFGISEGPHLNPRIPAMGVEPRPTPQRGSGGESEDRRRSSGKADRKSRGERAVHRRSTSAPQNYRMADGGPRAHGEPKVESRRGRSRPPVFEDCSGVRRRISPQRSATEQGPYQDGHASSGRVGGSTLLELRSDGGYLQGLGGPPPSREIRVLGVSYVDREDVNVVYDLEVEDTHCYFAGGILVHNCHEYSTDGSAQEISAHRLASLRPPTLLLSGSIMNGRAESLFTNWWASVRAFREAFGREDAYRFVDEYGFRKRLIQITDAVPEAVARGATTDRKDIPSIDRGSAPGVMPGFILNHLLPVSVTMRVEDVKELPPYKEIQIDLPLGDLARDHQAMMTALLDRMEADRFDEELGGALFGQLSEAPSQPDRATVDTGNQPDGFWRVMYPERVRDIVGDLVVHSVAPLPESYRTPKELKLLEIVRAELAEGRRAMVFVWNINLIPRIKRLLEGEFPREKVVHLDTGKVATGAREAWINKEVVRKGVRLMIANPVGIQTGLNNLTHFHTILWYQNPAVNPTIFSQANGRIRRIGQEKEARVYFLSYAACAQEAARVLLMDKASVAASVNGLDPMGALQAAGVGTASFASGMSVAKALHKMMTEGMRYRKAPSVVVKDSTRRSPILEVLGYDWLLP